MNLNRTIKNIPIIGTIARHAYHTCMNILHFFHDSERYWIDRYRNGGNSGDGSYDRLAEFKAEVLNAFVFENRITSAIEYGCGDGNQLGLVKYPKYLGFDISPDAISRCLSRFHDDKTKTFRLMKTYDGETAELTLSLDVIFHLVEDTVFFDYMNRLFDSSCRFVIIYSSNTDENTVSVAAHVRHRNFSRWVSENKSEWKIVQRIPNKYPFDHETKSGSFSDFFIYSRIGSSSM